MRIEAKHNPEIFKTENLERWNRIWKEKVIRHYIYLVASIAFLFLAIYLIRNSYLTGYMFFSLALFGLFTTINYLSYVSKQKKEFMIKIDKQSARHQQSNTPFFWELDDDYILYQDFLMSLKINWHAFSHYYTNHNSIYLVMSDTNDSPISINKSEVSEDEFSNVLKFIDGKLKSKSSVK